jgi:DNA-binding NarL/FixJ family response regulator
MPLALRGLRILLSKIVHHVSYAKDCTLPMCLRLSPVTPSGSIGLLDQTPKSGHGLDTIQSIKGTAPHIAVVVVSGAGGSATIRRCIDAGGDEL